MLADVKLKVTTTGGAGVATGSVTSDRTYMGWIERVIVDYTGVPATTDVTISEISSIGAAGNQNILVLSNRNTDGVFYPQVDGHDAAGAASGKVRPFITGNLKIDVAQSDAAVDGVVVHIQIRDIT